MVSFVPPAPSVRTSTFLLGLGLSPAWSGTWRMILTWSAGVPTSRETVGSEATDPKSSLSHRSGERSDRQWPPRAARTARFAVILPGSCTDHVRRHAVRARESSLPRPVTLVVSVNSLAPASPTAGTSLGSTPTAGYNPLVFTAKVSFLLEFSDLSNPHYPRRSDTFTPSSTPQQ